MLWKKRICEKPIEKSVTNEKKSGGRKVYTHKVDDT